MPLADRNEITLGRADGNGVVLDWDKQISRVHAALGLLAGSWMVEDHGLSSNGTFVNETRVSGRRRLRDGDVIRLGHVNVRFCDPGAKGSDQTIVEHQVLLAQPSTAQLRVLVELCRPLLAGEAGATTATNRDIAAELHLSLDAVKTHMRALFDKFDVGDLAQNAKRTALAQRAIASGIVSLRDLG